MSKGQNPQSVSQKPESERFIVQWLESGRMVAQYRES